MTPFLLTPYPSNLPFLRILRGKEIPNCLSSTLNPEELIFLFPFRLRLRMVCSLSIGINKSVLIS